ncbi:hypothetical protein ACFYKX_25415 [Cytobacillus sp. FJAT-54145]|uniref:Uncharacterized protein n=1 Tax=Cytobacillus spartinae TaxID=3299023 RepID=A0ABW6KI36_9BACI
MKDESIDPIEGFLNSAVIYGMQMTKPDTYSVLNKSEQAFVHHLLGFFSEYNDNQMADMLNNLLKSSRDMILDKYARRKPITEQDVTFANNLETLLTKLKENT